jgi:heparosan-N-sulfate-glucuronate 5-epimerase
MKKRRVYLYLIPLVALLLMVFGLEHDLLDKVQRRILQRQYYTSLRGYDPQSWRDAYIFDQLGIPQVDYKKDIGLQYNPTTVAQFALALFNDYLETGNKASKDEFFHQVEYLKKSYIEIDFQTVGYAYHFQFYNIEPGWYSGIAQGQILSVLYRAYLLEKDPDLLDLMPKVKNLMILPREQGGLLVHTPEGGIWIEEYPTREPSLVLNGFVFSIIGFRDYLELFPEDKESAKLYQNFLESLNETIELYDTGSWLLYDRLSSRPVKSHYIPIQSLQMEHLYEITKNPDYLELSRKWSHYEIVEN